jgi:peptide/nickel transport system ATP-binding protein
MSGNLVLLTDDREVRPDEALLEVHDLRVEHHDRTGRRRTILTSAQLTVLAGETVGIVGESGSGKSMLAKAVARLLPRDVYATGSVRFAGKDVFALPRRQLDALRGGGITILYQDPFTMLNPLLTCGDHIAEGLPGGQRRSNRRGQLRLEAIKRLAEVEIHDPTVVDRYPFELSGGMRQRVAIAAALARDPLLFIADEPSTALDVTTQAEILALLRSVQHARGMGLVLITHDLRVAFSVCSRILVLYAGSLLETAPAAELEAEPLHPYSLGLLTSDPPVAYRVSPLPAIEGSVPSPDEVAGGCPFAPRCQWAIEACHSAPVALAEVAPGRFSACSRLSTIRSELSLQRRALLVKATVARRPLEATGQLLRVRDLRKVFNSHGGRPNEALAGVSLDIGVNESVGLVGESGSGKTTLARCIVGLEVPTSGTIEIAGVNRAERSRRSLHRSVQMVFQDPYSSLDPYQPVGSVIGETLRANGYDRSKTGQRIKELFSLVGLPESYIRRLPATLSGGERQRVAIARALAVEPRLIVCDEPVSALDVSVQAQVLNLFSELRQRLGLSYLFITHDLAVVRQVVDRVYVCFRGRIVEEGPVDEVLDAPKHSYTIKLISSIPGGRAPTGSDPQTPVAAPSTSLGPT